MLFFCNRCRGRGRDLGGNKQIRIFIQKKDIISVARTRTLHQPRVISLGPGILRHKKQYLKIPGNMKRVRGKPSFPNNGLHSRPSTFVTNVKLCIRNNRSGNSWRSRREHARIITVQEVLRRHFNLRFKFARSREIRISPVRTNAKPRVE